MKAVHLLSTTTTIYKMIDFKGLEIKATKLLYRLNIKEKVVRISLI
jgi:hypothetical protein